MEKIKIAKIYHNDKNKDGKPYVSKEGKSYSVCNIYTEDGRWVSGFDNQTTKSWAVGDTVEVDITKKGDFNNFKLPAKTVGGEELKKLEDRIETLEIQIEMIYKRIDEIS